MATDISTIFGMPLLELVEHVTDAQWGIMIVIAASVVVTGGLSYWNIRLTKGAAEKQVKLDSHRLLSDMLRITREFRPAIDHLLGNEDLTEEDRANLVRVMTYLTALNLARTDGLVRNRDVKVIYGPILAKMTNEKLKEIVGKKYADKFDTDPDFYRGLRTMRDDLVGS